MANCLLRKEKKLSDSAAGLLNERTDEEWRVGLKLIVISLACPSPSVQFFVQGNHFPADKVILFIVHDCLSRDTVHELISIFLVLTFFFCC